MAKNALAVNAKKADLIYVRSKVLRRLVRGDEEREGEKGACGWCV